MTDWNYGLGANGAVWIGSCLGGNPGYLALDGSEATYARINSGAYFGVVDIGSPQYITHIRYKVAHSGTCTISLSNDGSTYTPIDASAYVAGWNTVQLGGVTYRYFKLSFSFNTESVYAAEIIGPVEAPPPPLNPAPDYIEAWLDGLELNYVPTINDWLAAH